MAPGFLYAALKNVLQESELDQILTKIYNPPAVEKC